jgi:hypothetical protein
MAKKQITLSRPSSQSTSSGLKSVLTQLDKPVFENIENQQSQIDTNINSASITIDKSVDNTLPISIPNTIVNKVVNTDFITLPISIDNSIDNTALNTTDNTVDTSIANTTNNSIANSLSKTTRKPVVKKVSKAASISVAEPQSSDRLSEAVRALSEEHTLAEQKIYEAMYLETISRRRYEGYFSWTFLSEQTGFQNERTIRVAIDGLIDKKSIEVVGEKKAGRIGTRYHVYPPREILVRRRKAGIVVDPRSKKIL